MYFILFSVFNIFLPDKQHKLPLPILLPTLINISFYEFVSVKSLKHQHVNTQPCLNGRFLLSPSCGQKHQCHTDLVSQSLGEIITVPGNAEWRRKTRAQQMWGLVRNFICHCTLQQTSLLIRSPWIRAGIWTVCSWTDRMNVLLCSVLPTTHKYMHKYLLRFISYLFK